MGQAEARVIEAAIAPSVLSTGLGRVHLGRAAFGCTTVLGAVALGLDLDTGSSRTLIYVAVTEVVALLGVLLTSRRPEHRVSWVIAIAALWWAIAAFTYGYAVEALVNRPGSLPGGLGAAWLDNWAWLPGLALFLSALIVLMPDGRLPSAGWWPAPTAVLAGTVLSSFWVSTASKFDLNGKQIANPLSSNSTVASAAGVTGSLLVLAGLVASLVAFVARYRRSGGDERQQLRWVVVSGCVSVCLAVIGAFAWGAVPGAAVLPALALLALPTGMVIAILKYRLYELDLVVNRAAVYALLTAGVVGIYVVVVGLVGAYLSRRADLLVSLAVTGVVAVSFQPLREHVQRFVNRLMYGDRDDPYIAIAGLSRILASSLQIETVLPAAVETIGRTLALQYVAVAVDSDRGLAHASAAYGSQGSGEVLVLPLVHQDTPVGELHVAPRPGEQLRERDRRLIADLAPQVAAAAHAVTLSRELQTARQRLVELREEERRRIRRDLHDGLGPALAGLTLTLEAVGNLAESDLQRAVQLLDSATTQVQTLVGDVRTLIYGLRPAALDELGLAASLRALATRDSTCQTTVNVDAPPSLPELPAAVEVAAYWIAQEALTNVLRHAHARTCVIRLTVQPSVVRLEIEDDGSGLGEASPGLGLHTMRERAAELGGTCEIGPAGGGGTLVSASLRRLPHPVDR
jgi:signal transduction histidine kinase